MKRSGKLIFRAHSRQLRFIGHRRELRIDAFVDHANFAGWNVVQPHGIAFAALRHRDDGIGGAQETRHHGFEEGNVERLVRIGIELEDQIVQREDGSDVAQTREQMFGRVKDVGVAKGSILAEACKIGERGGQAPGPNRKSGRDRRQLIDRGEQNRFAALMIKRRQL